MLSRHRSGLIVVGDLELADFTAANRKRTVWSRNKGYGKGKKDGEPEFGLKLKYVQDGKNRYVKAEALRQVYWWFWSRSRKIEIAVPQEGGKEQETEE
ncbi:hypothetical protein ACQKWADRAFT_327576 [Trichoderma austrokoningii]